MIEPLWNDVEAFNDEAPNNAKKEKDEDLKCKQLEEAMKHIEQKWNNKFEATAKHPWNSSLKGCEAARVRSIPPLNALTLLTLLILFTSFWALLFDIRKMKIPEDSYKM